MPFVARRIGVRKPSESATSVAGGDRQGELFALYRYHAVFTDSPLTLVQAEKTHRAHAIIEPVHADLRSGPLAHLPSGSFAANSERTAPGRAEDRTRGDMISLVRIRSSQHAASQRAA